MAFEYKSPSSPPHLEQDSPWFKAFLRGADNAGIKINLGIFPASTDAAYIREVGIPALGFSPMPHTPVLLHDHNKFLNEKIFIEGVERDVLRDIERTGIAVSYDVIVY
jgi:aminoacylase